MNFELPIVITNFKTYKEATGHQALSLAKDMERLMNEIHVNFAIAGQAIDLATLAAGVSIPVLAQHVDGVGYGAHTGHISIDSIKNLGVDGSLLNHSEKRINDDQIAEAITKLKELEMISIVCAESVEEVKRFAALGPDLIAFEPLDLIGGDVSVSTERPEHISEAAKITGPNKLIVGAGVKNAEDLKKALELGACGVLVASGIVKAAKPMEALRNLCSPLIK